MFKKLVLLAALSAVSNLGFAETISCNISPDFFYSRIDLNTQTGQAQVPATDGEKSTGRVVVDKTYPKRPSYHMEFNERYANGSPALRMFALNPIGETHILNYAQFKRVNDTWALSIASQSVTVHCSESS